LAGSGAVGWPLLQMVARARPSLVPPASSRSQMAEIRPSIQLTTMNTINLVLLQYCLSSGKIMVRSDNLRVQEVGTAGKSGPERTKQPIQE